MTQKPMKAAESIVRIARPLEASRIEPDDDRPPLGSWWWVTVDETSRRETVCDRARPCSSTGKPDQWLGCAVELGSNYVIFEGVHTKLRMSLDAVEDRCERELHPEHFIRGKIDQHTSRVRELMGEIKELCHRLGVPMTAELAGPAESTSTALAVAHSTEDVKKHKNALVKAKDKSLPDLFKKVEAEHRMLATWMKAELIPAEAELERAKGVTEVIEHKIHVVELYAGLAEELVQVCEGEPAERDTKVKIMQRRHYMDEECLAEYEAGGMDFKSIKAFDKWIKRPHNMNRILPHARCIVGFRIRHHDKEYGRDYGDGTVVASLEDHIKFHFDNKENKRTFLYIRNGAQLWRMETSIEFDEKLFPDRAESELLGNHELWRDGHSVITARRRDEMIDEYKRGRAELAKELWAWKRAGYPDDDWIMPGATDVSFISHERIVGHRHGRPDDEPSASWKDYELVTPHNLYYDDTMKEIAEAAFEHNRIAVVIQGLLDRSLALHPHPPWRIWTPEGFAAGIDLVYDVSHALTPGDAVEWEVYRAQLNKSIRAGATTIGQRPAWERAMRHKWGYKWDEYDVGDGPDRIGPIARTKGNLCEFTFERERKRGKWMPHPTKPGYQKKSWDPIPMSWWCPASDLTCIDGYTPGDFHMFFDDPRTREQYLKWAPVLLAAEDWHAKRRNGSGVK